MFPWTSSHGINLDRHSTDERVRNGKPVTPAFLFGALLWDSVFQAAEELGAAGCDEINALQQAADRVIDAQIRQVSIPKRIV